MAIIVRALKKDITNAIAKNNVEKKSVICLKTDFLREFLFYVTTYTVNNSPFSPNTTMFLIKKIEIIFNIYDYFPRSI